MIIAYPYRKHQTASREGNTTVPSKLFCSSYCIIRGHRRTFCSSTAHHYAIVQHSNHWWLSPTSNPVHRIPTMLALLPSSQLISGNLGCCHARSAIWRAGHRIRPSQVWNMFLPCWFQEHSLLVLCQQLSFLSKHRCCPPRRPIVPPYPPSHMRPVRL